MGLLKCGDKVHMNVARFLLVGLLSAGAVNCGFETPKTQKGDSAASHPMADEVAVALSEWLPEQLEGGGVPGAAVAVVGNREIVWERVYGVAGGTGSARISEDTVFCIRSITKSVTALAVLMAVQDGLVDLDTPISNFLPGFSVHSRFDERPGDLITLRHMLSHWAGFTHDPPFDLDLERSDYFERYIASISDSWLRFPVGYRHQYSNYGLDLAAHLVQAKSGQSFDQYVRDKVLAPIGMVNSFLDLTMVEEIENRAIGYDQRGNPVPVHFPEIGAAGLYSSIRDMSKFIQFHLNGGVVDGNRLLGEELMRQYHSIQFGLPGQKTGYCLGLIREAVSNTYCLYHEGGGRGFASHMMIYPELGFGVILLTDLEENGLTGIQGRRIMNGPIIDRLGPIPAPEPRWSDQDLVSVGDPRVEEIIGRYGDSPGYVVAFEDGVLGLRTGESSFFPLTIYDDEGELVGAYGSNREVRFLPSFGDHSGSLMIVDLVVGNSNSNYLEFNDSPMDPPGPGKSEWQQYHGEYDVIWDGRAFATISVTTRNGYLYYRDGKCVEHEPGLFFLYDGETIDFRSEPPRAANLEIEKRP